MTNILVDGSNVLFWGGNQPLAQLPMLVVCALHVRRYTPVVYFDSSISRHLGKKHFDALSDIATINFAPDGTPADAILLEECEEGRLQIVSCDRFRDWRSEHPRLRADWLVTGRYNKGGRLSFSKKLRRVRI